MVSICFFKFAAASSFSLSPCVLSCFFRASSSSFCALSSVCLGSYFFCSACKSRCPSLLPKIASWMLIIPTFSGVEADPCDREGMGRANRQRGTARAKIRFFIPTPSVNILPESETTPL